MTPEIEAPIDQLSDHMAVNMAVRHRGRQSTLLGSVPRRSDRTWVECGGSPPMSTVHQVVNARADRDARRVDRPRRSERRDRD